MALREISARAVIVKTGTVNPGEYALVHTDREYQTLRGVPDELPRMSVSASADKTVVVGTLKEVREYAKKLQNKLKPSKNAPDMAITDELYIDEAGRAE